MSWVANLLLAVNGLDEPLVETLSEWLKTDCPIRHPIEPGDSGGVGSLRSLTDPDHNQWGGSKNPECTVWGGALNHADLAAVRKQVESMPWREPQWVQLLLEDQEEMTFRLYMFDGDKLRQYAPVRDDDEFRSLPPMDRL